MITRQVDDKSVSVIPEEPDDLLALRRVVKINDRITGDTTRVIKRDRDFARPDRGERVRIRIALSVEKISLDNVLDKLRIQGSITESSNESVPHGSHHSILVRVGDAITITKTWSAVEKKLVSKSDSGPGFVLVAVDTVDCGIGRLKGTRLHITPNMYSGASGKRYKTNFKIQGFFDEIARAVLALAKSDDTVIIFGPGETRKKLANHLDSHSRWKLKTIVVEGIDSSGEDGIYAFARSKVMRQVMSGSKLARASKMVDDVMAMAGRKSRKFAMGYNEAKKANELGAIDSLVFSDRIIQDIDEQEIVDFLNDLERNGVRPFAVDSTTDIGLRVSGLGGIISILRFPID